MTRENVADGRGGFFEIEIADGKPSYNWTTTPPTEPGWYWASPVIFWRFADMKPSIVFVAFGQSGELIVSDDKLNDIDMKNFSHWLGPLPVPEPPKE